MLNKSKKESDYSRGLKNAKNINMTRRSDEFYVFSKNPGGIIGPGRKFTRQFIIDFEKAIGSTKEFADQEFDETYNQYLHDKNYIVLNMKPSQDNVNTRKIVVKKK